MSKTVPLFAVPSMADWIRRNETEKGNEIEIGVFTSKFCCLSQMSSRCSHSGAERGESRALNRYKPFALFLTDLSHKRQHKLCF